jgi:hypothetical protein
MTPYDSKILDLPRRRAFMDIAKPSESSSLKKYTDYIYTDYADTDYPSSTPNLKKDMELQLESLKNRLKALSSIKTSIDMGSAQNNRIKRKPKSKRRRRRSKSKSRRRRSLNLNNKKSVTKKSCRKRLSNKIRTNMNELKAGRWVNKQQAIAVSFSQINKLYPKCKRYYKRKY